MDIWINEYETLMFGADHTLHTMDLAAELKYKHMPEILYKYRNFDPRKLDALKNDYQICSDPITFNDPYESPIRFLLGKINRNIVINTFNNTRHEYPNLPDEILDLTIGFFLDNKGSEKELFNRFPRQFKAISQYLKYTHKVILDEQIRIQREYTKSMYNICCMSASCNIMPMWAHYAENHSGFCIGYGIKELGLTHNLTQLTLPVIYRQNETIEIDNIDYLDGSMGMHALSLKNISWSYEQEWRIFSIHDGSHSRVIMPIPKHVILGINMPENNKKDLVSICFEKGIKVKQMVFDKNEHKLTPIDV